MGGAQNAESKRSANVRGERRKYLPQLGGSTTVAGAYRCARVPPAVIGGLSPLPREIVPEPASRLRLRDAPL